MATLKHIRKRIKSVKNTQKITKAMKMVAAAKLRRAQQAIVSARPYAAELGRMLSDVVSSLDADTLASHPLLSTRAEIKRTAVVVFSSDRGLCGAFNTNVVKKAIATIQEERALGRDVEVITFGRKGRDGLTARRTQVTESKTDIGKWTLQDLRELLGPLLTRYETGELDQIILIYNRFVSAISQDPTAKRLLPFEATPSAKAGVEAPKDYEYEPNRLEFSKVLVEKMVFSAFQLAYLESIASELGARMSAMDSATNNASEMIRKLTLVYNRARQAAITLELMDIVNGAESIS